MKKDGEENIWGRKVFPASIPEDTNSYDRFYFFVTRAHAFYIRREAATKPQFVSNTADQILRNLLFLD